MKQKLLLTILALLGLGMAEVQAQPRYYSTGARWTELQLDTLLYDSWYEEIVSDGKVSYKPNFEVVEYYVGEEYKGELDTDGELLHGIYVHREGRPDSLVCYLAQDTDNLSLTAIVDGESKPYMANPTSIYYFPLSPKVGDPIRFISLGYAQVTGGYFEPPFAYVKEVGYGSFGTPHQHKYVLLDNGICIVDNIGVTSWKGKECITGPAEVYWSVADFAPYDKREKIMSEHHHRSMLVRFEHKGEVLYNMWPNAKGELTQGVPQIAGVPQKAKGIYDLQGRKLTRQPDKGMYIEDGKVMTR